jgi:hypothetical protein
MVFSFDAATLRAGETGNGRRSGVDYTLIRSRGEVDEATGMDDGEDPIG